MHFLSYLNLLYYVNSCLMLRYIYCLRLVLVDNWYPLEYLKNSFAPAKGIYRLSTFIIKNLLSTNLNHMIFFWGYCVKIQFQSECTHKSTHIRSHVSFNGLCLAFFQVSCLFYLLLFLESFFLSLSFGKGLSVIVFQYGHKQTNEHTWLCNKQRQTARSNARYKEVLT